MRIVAGASVLSLSPSHHRAGEKEEANVNLLVLAVQVLFPLTASVRKSMKDSDSEVFLLSCYFVFVCVW